MDSVQLSGFQVSEGMKDDATTALARLMRPYFATVADEAGDRILTAQIATPKA